MSEQFPLLCDDLSEEERFSPHFRRRLMSRDRARNHMKGAAAIITRWPEHWTTLLNYWWIGIGMIALSTYILYTCVFSYAMMQSHDKIHPKPFNIKTSKLIPKVRIPPKVFMHIFVDDKQEIDLNDYLPYIKIITNKYEHFNYELLIIANDTNIESTDYSDKKNNENALNMLWTNDFNYKNILSNNSNLNISYMKLSKYLYDSPLKKCWRSLPQQFIKFLVRAASIWEKGGVVFDPVVLTPQSPHSAYIDKVYAILKTYKTKNNKVQPPLKKSKQHSSNTKNKEKQLKPNNIQDVINALEGNDTIISYQEPLAEAESRTNINATFGRKLLSIVDASDEEDKVKQVPLSEVRNTESDIGPINHKGMIYKELFKDKQKDNSSKLNLLPMFLDYLFQNKQMKSSDEIMANTANLKSDIVPKMFTATDDNSLHMRDFQTETTDQIVYKPMIISAKAILDKPDVKAKVTDSVQKGGDSIFELTIDLKGNVISTDTACHAFIGNMFTNAINHDISESVTDFIIKELSIFCNGLLASCVGIDVILL